MADLHGTKNTGVWNRPLTRIAAVSALLLGVGALAMPGLRAEEAFKIPAPAVDETTPAKSEVAVLAGGCFWGVQGVFQHVKGVSQAVSGYTGGEAKTAEYEVVSGGRTGHAESVRITFDPSQVSYGKLLQIYFSVAHDPTELNYQGPDTGTQYRSAIFPTSAEQERIAKAYIAQLNQAHAYGGPVVTTVESGSTFYPAEGYHQDFLARNPTYPYIAINDLPKVSSLKKMFPDSYRTDPVLVMASSATN